MSDEKRKVDGGGFVTHDANSHSALIKQQEKVLNIALIAVLTGFVCGGFAFAGFEKFGAVAGFLCAVVTIGSMIAFAALKTRESRE